LPEGGGDDAFALLVQIKDVLGGLACPTIVPPGNHDGRRRQVEAVSGPLPEQSFLAVPALCDPPFQ
jgi:hypothetical protein